MTQHPCYCNVCLRARDEEIKRVREAQKKGIRTELLAQCDLTENEDGRLLVEEVLGGAK